jgi:hypothetical protein
MSHSFCNTLSVFNNQSIESEESRDRKRLSTSYSITSQPSKHRIEITHCQLTLYLLEFPSIFESLIRTATGHLSGVDCNSQLDINANNSVRRETRVHARVGVGHILGILRVSIFPKAIKS